MESNDTNLLRDVPTRVHLEQVEAQKPERYGVLFDLVNSRYDASETLKPKEKIAYKIHYLQVVDAAIERSVECGVDIESREDHECLVVAAILHDLTKGDPAPVEFSELKFYTIVAHGQQASDEVPSILKNNPHILTEITGEQNPSDEDIARVSEKIQRGILAHMGPNPGIMNFFLTKTNNQLEELGYDPIVHPRPKPGDRIAEILYAADMRTLASESGIQKIVQIRASGEHFRKEDQLLAEKLNNIFNIKATRSEIALMSAFQGAQDAVDSIKDPGDRTWVKKVLNDGLSGEYQYQESEDEDIALKMSTDRRVLLQDAIKKLPELPKFIDSKLGITAQTEKEIEQFLGSELAEAYMNTRSWADVIPEMKKE